jgi:hypothetical protein
LREDENKERKGAAKATLVFHRSWIHFELSDSYTPHGSFRMHGPALALEALKPISLGDKEKFNA